MRRAMVFQSPWGWMGISETSKGIDRIALPVRSRQAVDQTLADHDADEYDVEPSPQLNVARQQVLEYLAAKRSTFDLPLDLSQGTPFQRQVWRILQRVPFGKLRSYQWIAARVGGVQYARAVGNAVGANPLPIVIPCHRIVAQDASLGGFSGGLPMKRKLLSLEGTLAQLQQGRSAR